MRNTLFHFASCEPLSLWPMVKAQSLMVIPLNSIKCFWNPIGIILVKSLNYFFNMGLLSVSQKRDVISLIPKDGKDDELLKNWRPISLLSVDYKIAAKVIANRMKKVLSSVISNDQTGFLPNR